MKQIALPLELARAQEKIEGHARNYGLSFFQTVFEMVDYDQMNALAAYGGFPTRYPHYRFGMEYQRMAKSYEYGLHKIYEMVINNDPTYAYLLEGNSMMDQKLVMAHVYGHADFFFNNFYFSHTNRKMIDEMANHGTRIRRYQERYGVERVEQFLDACLAIEELIDPNAVFLDESSRGIGSTEEAPELDTNVLHIPAKPYMDRYINPPEYLEKQRKKLEKQKQAAKRFPARPERDVLGFIMQHAPLENWERDVMGMIREESYYFLPQRQTKVMNEGWASYWHTTIMTNKVLDDSEVIDYADHHSGTVATAPGQLNPYKLGLELFRDIERRWNTGQFGSEWEACEDMAERNSWNLELGQGREKIYEIRKIHSDVTFLDEFLTPEFCMREQFFVTKQDPKTKKSVISTREFDQVKQALLFQFSNGGWPVIEVLDANFGNRGELCLAHRHVGVDLKLDWAQEVLGAMVKLWRRPVRIETMRGQSPLRMSHDGEKSSEESLVEPATKAS